MNRYALFLLLILAAPSALAQSIDDPWSLVPEFPRSCYTTEGDFDAKVAAALEPLSAEYARREQINDAITQQYSSMDLMEQQQRMMDLMMEHPEEAQIYMQSLATMGQEVSADVTAMSNARMQLEEEFREITARYEAAYQEEVGVQEERWARWLDDVNNSRTPEGDADEIHAQINARYEALCASWWKDGPFHEWLARHRQAMIEEARTQDESLPATIRTYELMGIDVDGYSSTATLRAVNEHISTAVRIFGKRRSGVSRPPDI